MKLRADVDQRYAAGKSLMAGLLTVTESLVIEFSIPLMKSGTPAWQQLQGVRAAEAYRNLVLTAQMHKGTQHYRIEQQGENEFSDFDQVKSVPEAFHGHSVLRQSRLPFESVSATIRRT